MSTKPKPLELDDLVARAKRGPDQHGRWYWTARWTDEAGQRHEQSLGWLDRAAAKKAAAGLLADPQRRTPEPQRADELRTMRDVLEAWLGHQELRLEAGEVRRGTLKGYRTGVAFGLGHLGDVRAEHLTSDLLYDTMLELRRRLASTTTVQIGRVISMAHAWALERGYIAGKPVRVRMSPEPRAVDVPDAHETEAILAALPASPAWVRPYITLVASTGARPSEIALLRRRHVVELDDGVWVTIPDEEGAKTGARSVPVQEWVLPVLRPLLDCAPDARLFPSSAPMRGNTYLRDAGASWRFRSLRRAASDALAATPGVTPAAFGAVLGHSPETSVRFYQGKGSVTLRAAIQAASLGRPKRGRVLRLAVSGGDTDRGQYPQDPHGDDV